MFQEQFELPHFISCTMWGHNQGGPMNRGASSTVFALASTTKKVLLESPCTATRF